MKGEHVLPVPAARIHSSTAEVIADEGVTFRPHGMSSPKCCRKHVVAGFSLRSIFPHLRHPRNLRLNSRPLTGR